MPAWSLYMNLDRANLADLWATRKRMAESCMAVSLQRLCCEIAMDYFPSSNSRTGQLSG